MADASDRTLPATPRRREAARLQGVVPMAAAPAWIATVAAVVLLLPSWTRATLPAAVSMMRESLVAAIIPRASSPDAAAGMPVLPASLLLPTAAVILLAGGIGLAVRFLLDGSAWRLSRAAPTLRRIDPLAGLARMLSPATGLSLLGSAAGLAVLAAAAAFAARPLVGLIAGSADAHEPAAAFAVAQRGLLTLVAAAGLLAACQWGLARLRFERHIRMTPQEFADESRSIESNPRIRFMRDRGLPARRPEASDEGDAPAGVARGQATAGTS